MALSSACFPEIVAGPLPVVYPFIVSNPGEAAQAKRRIAAVTLGHLPPPLTDAGLDENQQKLERLVDEYAQADGLDRRRRDQLAKLIVETAAKTGLAAEAGVGRADAPDEALRRIDAWLCDLKDFAVKDGLHVYGRAEADEPDAMRRLSADAERDALVAALDGRHVAAGPSGAPARGRTDVLPTGRNLFTADPRTMPTPTAFDIGQAAADEVLRRYQQDNGDWPRSLVIDLWGSASLRTGGEEIAQGLALMGCRPQWDAATGRVTGIEVLPPATARPPARRRHLAHFGPVPRHVPDPDRPDRRRRPRRRCARRGFFGKPAGARPPARPATCRRASSAPRPAPMAPASKTCWHRATGATAANSAAPISTPPRMPMAAPAAKAFRRPAPLPSASPAPTCWSIPATIPAATFSKARPTSPSSAAFRQPLPLLGGKADVIVLDTTDPRRPRPRSVGEAVTRVVRARAVNPRFIEGQMRHGPRGASEFAETVDRLIGFAETTARHSRRADRGAARRLCRRREGARLHAAREPGRREIHRRALRRRHPARPLAPAQEQHWR